MSEEVVEEILEEDTEEVVTHGAVKRTRSQHRSHDLSNSRNSSGFSVSCLQTLPASPGVTPTSGSSRARRVPTMRSPQRDRSSHSSARS